MTDCISLLFQKVEDKHGYMMVAHSLAYVTASKNGITESEIEDIISLGECSDVDTMQNNNANMNWLELLPDLGKFSQCPDKASTRAFSLLKVHSILYLPCLNTCSA